MLPGGAVAYSGMGWWPHIYLACGQCPAPPCPTFLLRSLPCTHTVHLFPHSQAHCVMHTSSFLQTDADPEVCKKMCKRNEFESVLALVAYYQMVCARQRGGVHGGMCGGIQAGVGVPETQHVGSPTRNTERHCACCSSNALGPCAALMQPSSPRWCRPCCLWSWPGTCRQTRRVRWGGRVSSHWLGFLPSLGF